MMMGDMELHPALQEDNEENPPIVQEARSRSPPPSSSYDKSIQAVTPPPTIRKMAEGWRKEKDEKAESNKRMEISWNMVGLVGWWRRVERENLKQIKDEEKKQRIEAKTSSIRKSQTSAKLSFVRKFFADTKNKPEQERGTNPQTQSKPNPKARK